MCASCVSQGALYLGGSVAALRVMAHRAGGRRRPDAGADAAAVAGAAGAPSPEPPPR